MNIISYRGPGMAGGVSSGLARVWREQMNGSARWRFLEGSDIRVLRNGNEKSNLLATLAATVIQGHYRYCNEFLWPVMHDLPQYASLHEDDRDLYKQFNLAFARVLRQGKNFSDVNFIQDYQLALLPQLMGATRNVVFWHIPWPKSVDSEYTDAIAEIVRGLLYAKTVGFHTAEYAENFMCFVEQYVPEYFVDRQNNSILRTDGRHGRALNSPRTVLASPLTLYSNSTFGQATALGDYEMTSIVVCPLGLDLDHWTGMANSAADRMPIENLNGPFVLSVDRADYTKGVLERIQMIDRFFEVHPDKRQELTFVQICGKTRAGLRAFDEYWNECQWMGNVVNGRWSTQAWRPIVWVENQLPSADLAALYRKAQVMLVNPIRDGLNLTAKEYAICQQDNPGALLLSPGAGVWHELGNFALAVNPRDPDQELCSSLIRATNMPLAECRARNQLMKQQLRKQSLTHWWMQFTADKETAAIAPSVSTRRLATA